MSDDHHDAKAALTRDLDRTARAATDLVRDAMGLAHATATGTWHFTQMVAEAVAQTSRQIAGDALAADQSRSSTPRTRPATVRPAGRVADRDHGSQYSPSQAAELAQSGTRTNARHDADSELRSRGDQLLDRSADARAPDDPHPAYQRILDDLAPDEARILRVLALRGPQPSVDVRTNRPFGVGSEKIAGGLSMIGELAGCRHLDRTHAYFNNLHRLGLLWFSKEPVDLHDYQLLEVQPAVVDTVARAGRAAKIIRRSIQLTPFGEDLCRRCFTLAPEE